MMQEWKYVRPLHSMDKVEQFENKIGYRFSNKYKELVLEYNGGRPKKDTFVTKCKIEHTMKKLLSFDDIDKENIWNINSWNIDGLEDKYVAFAIDHFGNLICFDKRNDYIVFLDHETLKIDIISKNFDDFLKLLK